MKIFFNLIFTENKNREAERVESCFTRSNRKAQYPYRLRRGTKLPEQNYFDANKEEGNVVTLTPAPAT